MPSIADHHLHAALNLVDFDSRAAQRPMEPTFRGSPPADFAEEDARDAAALLYAFVDAGELHFPLTLRREHLREHRGQVSLPGGRPHGDESLWETAVREAHEEVGLDPSLPTRVGRLAPVYIPVTHTRLHVYVAAGPAPDELVAQPEEVADIAVFPLADLVDDTKRRSGVWTILGRDVNVAFFGLQATLSELQVRRAGDLAEWKVWGATAMALSELAERMKCVLASSL